MHEISKSVLPPDLTAAQRAIWLDQQFFSDKPVYNTGQILTIHGNLRFDVFETALRNAVAESPWLRLPQRAGPLKFDLPLLDFRKERDPAAAVEQWIRNEMNRALPLRDPTLFRFALIRISNSQTLWFQKFHHIIIDATGRRLLSARTAARYRALRFGESLPTLTALTPEEILDSERRYAASEESKLDRGFWLKLFADRPDPLLEVERRNTERARSGRHARVKFNLSDADFTKMTAIARSVGSSEFRLIIALVYVAFARLYNRFDLVLGLELANRSNSGAKQVIGLLAQPLPLLLRLNHSATIADVLHRLNECQARDYPHRHFPIQELVKDLGLKPAAEGLFDIIINYLPAAYDCAFEELPVEVTNLSYGFTSPFMVTIAHTSINRDLEVTVDTDPGLISAERSALLATCIESLFCRGINDLARPISLLPIMSEQGERQVLGLGSGETVKLPEDPTLAVLCAEQAERTPNKVAVICGEHQLSFSMLHAQATSLAKRLAAIGIRPGMVVGVALPRTPSLIIAVLGVHKAGAAYLALDPSYPIERIHFIVADAAATVILTDSSVKAAFVDTGAKLLLLGTDLTDAETETIEPVGAHADDLAYVLYTSGSTGRPKAVGIQHRNLINLITWGRSIVSDAELDGMLFSTSLNFDLSAFEMFLPLVFGGCIILVENLLTLQSIPCRDQVRLVNTGPTLFEALLRVADLPGSVTTVILAGERLSRRLATMAFEAAPGVRLLNCYGPTETTVYSSYANIESTSQREPTIGRAIWNTTLYVLGPGCALLPRGVEGELYIGGAGVAPGYLGRAELTAERFLPNPYGSGHLYRTGDRVRWASDGELEFLGRADHQIKIHGVRVEPGEVEAALLALPVVAACIVKLWSDDTVGPRLAAYLVPSSEELPETETLREQLQRLLPLYMVPYYFIWLPALPMTPNGKVDRAKLPAPPRPDAGFLDHNPPRTRLEREIVEIWEGLLQRSPIGIRSDFFDLGGDSLALVSLLAIIEARFGRRLPSNVLFAGLTVAELARALVDDKLARAETDPIVAFQPLGDLPPFFCVHGISGEVVHLRRLANHMGTDRPFFALQRPSDAALTDTIHQIAERYVSAIRTRQPDGPFYLGGHSFGAMVAYEIALQLANQGQEIGLLAIIDQRAPGSGVTLRGALPALPKILANMPRHFYDEIRQMPMSARLQATQRILLRWLKVALGSRPSVVSMFHLDPSDTKRLQLFDAHLRALRQYRSTKLPVPIVLFRAKVPMLSDLVMDSALGWNGLAKGAVRVRFVPGNHDSMTAEPLVRHLAEALREELDTVQRPLK
jgi:amino acid adenylation domain-containing protein